MLGLAGPKTTLGARPAPRPYKEHLRRAAIPLSKERVVEFFRVAEKLFRLLCVGEAAAREFLI
jgi:hypothetical protein